MVKVKNKVLIALSILLCAILFSSIFVFTDNAKSLNADTETQSQNNVNVQSNELTAMVTGTDLEFPVDWITLIATKNGFTVNSGSENIAYEFEKNISSIWFTQTIPTDLGYTKLCDLDTGLPVYQKTTTINDTTTYDLAFVNESGRIIAPVNSSALFGSNLYGKYDEGETCNTIAHGGLEENLKSITFDAYTVEENGQKVTKSIFDTSNVTNMADMFSTGSITGYRNEVVISGIEYWDTANVKNMSGMFAQCGFAHKFEVNLSNLNTSNVTNMLGMLVGNWYTESIDVSSFDTSKVTNMNSMFNGLGAQVSNGIADLDLSHFDTSNVTDMSGMFVAVKCNIINVSSFNTQNVTTMQKMFSGCSSLQSINIGNFDTSKVTDMSEMFNGCSSLTGLVFSNTWDTSNVTTMVSMFKDCSSLTSLDVTNFDTSKVTMFWQMFSGCSSLKSIDLSKFSFDADMGALMLMFENCASLTSIDLSNYTKPAVLGKTFSGCTNLKTVDISGVQVTNAVDVFENCNSLTKIVLPQSISVSFTLPTISALTINKADHYGYVGDNNEVVSITTDGTTTITSDMAGKTIELYDSENNSLVAMAPIEPATGVNASVVAIVCSMVAIVMIVFAYGVISNKKNNKRKVNAINIDTNKRK